MSTVPSAEYPWEVPSMGGSGFFKSTLGEELTERNWADVPSERESPGVYCTTPVAIALAIDSPAAEAEFRSLPP
jgi:hypothetical protein